MRGDVGETVRKRVGEFEKAGRGKREDVFKELCFCILTANYNAERAIAIQDAVGDGFMRLSEPLLAKKLKELGYRFPNARARYIVEARKHIPELHAMLSSGDEMEVREAFAESVKGLGYKEASHFLRNIGFKNLAIIDFHIVDILVANNLVRKPKSMSKERYMEIESVLGGLSKKIGITQSELDLYLWYMETGKILK